MLQVMDPLPSTYILRFEPDNILDVEENDLLVLKGFEIMIMPRVSHEENL